MLNVIPGRPFATSVSIPQTTLLGIQGQIPYILIGTNWQRLTPADIVGDNAAAGVANGATLSLYTVTAGKKAVIFAWLMSTSALGIIRLRHNAVTIASASLAAGGVVSENISGGWIMPTTGGVIDILNSTGAASNIAGHVLLAEYTP